MTKPRIQSLWRTWRWPVVVVALAAAAWGAKVAFFTDPPAPEVITVAVERGEIEDTVLAAGTMRPRKKSVSGPRCPDKSSGCTWPWVTRCARAS